MIKNLVTMAAVVFFYSCSTGQTKHENYNLSPVEFSEQMTVLKDVTVLDVRTPKEFNSGYVKGAINIDWNSDAFESEVEKLDKSKPIMVYCLSGGRSAAAAEHLKDVGFTNIYQMNGGMISWRNENLPEESTINTTSMNFKDYDKLLTSDKVVLVDFYAEWCAPCKKMEPYLNAIAEDSKDKVVVVRIDADKNPELCKQLKVSGLPVLKLYKNKELLWDQLGFVEEEVVRSKIKDAVK